MASNMYRVGDCVYFETSSTTPYQIRRIEELCKTPNGNVEAKVMCFYRRRDISSALIVLADKHQNVILEEDEASDDKMAAATAEREELSEKQRHQLKHRELFLSRQVETLPATHIRGKCVITLLNETESFHSYLGRDDSFFYSLVYDPQEKTLLADKGEIRIGSQYQAELIPRLLKKGEADHRDLSKLEELVWDSSNLCSDHQIEQFLIISRSIGTFARSLDCSSTIRQPSLHMSAASASRDITLFHAMNVLHDENYNVTKATQRLVPHSGPVLCRDEMEEWSASEANLFEEALDKYGKDFRDIRQDFLPWKSLKSIVEYYYMWKTTDRYVQQKRIKAADSESKLKQVYIPNYNKPNPAQIVDKMNGVDGMSVRSCESCYTYHSSQWYNWGPVHMQCRLCASCWIYWKKHGGLKMPTKLDSSSVTDRLVQMTNTQAHRCQVKDCEREFLSKLQLEQHVVSAHGLAQVGLSSTSSLSESPFLVMKTKSAFCLVTTPLTRISRQVCKGILDICRAGRRPFNPINIALIKQECQQRLPELVKKLRLLKTKKRVQMDNVSERLGIDVKMDKPSLLQHTAERKELPKHAFPAAPSDRTKSTPTDHSVNLMLQLSRPSSSSSSSSSRKRTHEHVNGTDGGGSPPMKLTATGVIRQVATVKQKEPKMRGSAINRLNSRGATKGNVPVRTRKQNTGSSDTPDDLFFVATESTRRLRKLTPTSALKQAARVPWRKVQPAGGGGGKTPASLATKEKEAEGIVILD